MTTIEVLLEDVLIKEGGYVNHPNDRGGPTNYGITQKTLSNYYGREATVDEVKNLELETAREIYETNYYRAPRIDTFPEEIQPLAFDMAVNHGPRRSIRITQQVVNLAGFGPIDEDGAMGPQTRKQCFEAQEAMGNYFNNAIVDQRISYYHAIVANNSSQQVFLRGWLSRAESFRKKL